MDEQNMGEELTQKAGEAVKTTAKLAAGAARFLATGDVSGLIEPGVKVLKWLVVAVLCIFLIPAVLIGVVIYTVFGNAVNALVNIYQPENAAAHTAQALEDRDGYSTAKGHLNMSDGYSEEDALAIKYASLNENFNNTYLDYALVVERNLERALSAAQDRYEQEKAAAQASVTFVPHQAPAVLYTADGNQFFDSVNSGLPIGRANAKEGSAGVSAAAAVAGQQQYDMTLLDGMIWDDSSCSFDKSGAVYTKGIVQIIASYMTMKADSNQLSTDSEGNLFSKIQHWFADASTVYSSLSDFKMMFDDPEVLENLFEYTAQTGQQTLTGSVPVKTFQVRHFNKQVRNGYETIQGEQRPKYRTAVMYYLEPVDKEPIACEYQAMSYSASLGEFKTKEMLSYIFTRFGSNIWNENTIQYVKKGGSGGGGGGGNGGGDHGGDGSLSGSPNWNSSAYQDRKNASNTGQCCWFSRCRTVELYGWDIGEATGNGKDCARNWASQNPQLFTLSSTPAPGAIFSGWGDPYSGGYGHTGVIVSVNGDTIVTDEGNVGGYADVQIWSTLGFNAPTTGGNTGYIRRTTTLTELRAMYPGGLEFAVPTEAGKARLNGGGNLSESGDWDERGESGRVTRTPSNWTYQPNGNEENAIEAAGVLSDAGVSLNAIAGILGNMYQESQYDPGINLNSPGAAFGLLQWDPSSNNRARVQNYLRQNGYELTSVEGQMRFAVQSLDSDWLKAGAWAPISAAAAPYGYSAKEMSWSEFKTSSASPGDLATTFCAYYERCNPALAHMEKRTGAAEYWADYLSKNGFGNGISEDKMILVGDSRFVGIQNDASPKGSVIAKVGAGLSDLQGSLGEQLKQKLRSSSEGTGVVFGFGVNDGVASGASFARQYANVFNDYAEKYPKTKIFVTSVNPIDAQKGAKNGYTSISSGAITNEKIQAFNSALKAALSSKVTFVDTYSKVASQSYQTNDGLHYTPEWNKKIYEIIKEAVCTNRSGNRTGSNASQGVWQYMDPVTDWTDDPDVRLATVLGAPYYSIITRFYYKCKDSSGANHIGTNPSHCTDPECPHSHPDDEAGEVLLRVDDSGTGFFSRLVMSCFHNLSPKYDFSQWTENPKWEYGPTPEDELDLFPDMKKEDFPVCGPNKSEAASGDDEEENAPEAHADEPDEEGEEAEGNEESGSSSSGSVQRLGPSLIYTVQDQINYYIDNIFYGVDGKNSDMSDMDNFAGGAVSKESGVSSPDELHINLLGSLLGSNSTSMSESFSGDISAEFDLTYDASGNIIGLKWKNPPDYCQWDNGTVQPQTPWGGNWANVQIGLSTIAHSACTITSYANAVTALTGNKVDLVQLCQDAHAAGIYNVACPGTFTGNLGALQSKWGFGATPVNTKEELRQALLNGQIVIPSMVCSVFWTGGNHAISLFGYRPEDGSTYVCDPNHPRASGDGVAGRWYTLDYIMQYAMPGGTVAIGPSDTAKNKKNNSQAGSSGDSESSSSSSNWTGPKLTASAGSIMGPSGKETYYNLDMSGVVNIMRQQGFSASQYPYRVRSDGVKMLGNYVMIAANLSRRPRGSKVQTSLGMGLVCDTGGFAASNPNQIDIAVNW